VDRTDADRAQGWGFGTLIDPVCRIEPRFGQPAVTSCVLSMGQPASHTVTCRRSGGRLGGAAPRALGARGAADCRRVGADCRRVALAL